MNDFEVGDKVKHHQTKHRTWEVASYNRRTGRLVLQRRNAKGRLIQQQAMRPEEYRIIEKNTSNHYIEGGKSG